MAADLINQRFPSGLNMPIGLTTGLLGGLYLLWRLTRDEKMGDGRKSRGYRA